MSDKPTLTIVKTSKPVSTEPTFGEMLERDDRERWAAVRREGIRLVTINKPAIVFNEDKTHMNAMFAEFTRMVYENNDINTNFKPIHT